MTEQQRQENEAVAKFLLPDIIKLAKKHDGLLEPDEVTQRIMLRCLGVGFSLGVAYGKASSDKNWRDKLSDAFAIVKESK